MIAVRLNCLASCIRLKIYFTATKLLPSLAFEGKFVYYRIHEQHPNHPSI